MASINGIRIENPEYTEYEGRILYAGEVYMDNQKLGFWSMRPRRKDFYGFDTKVIEERVALFKEGFPNTSSKKRLMGDPMGLMRVLIALGDREYAEKVTRNRETSLDLRIDKDHPAPNWMV